MKQKAFRQLTAKAYLVRLAATAVALLILLLASPGIGTQSSSIGWWDAWRARLGITIPAQELVGFPLADRDGDGAVSEEEAQGFTALFFTI